LLLLLLRLRLTRRAERRGATATPLEHAAAGGAVETVAIAPSANVQWLNEHAALKSNLQKVHLITFLKMA
jgi:hypothetical protein